MNQVIHGYTQNAVMTLPREGERIIIEGDEYSVGGIEHIFPKKDDKKNYHVQIFVFK
jgi:hypothetical protein